MTYRVFGVQGTHMFSFILIKYIIKYQQDIEFW